MLNAAVENQIRKFRSFKFALFGCEHTNWPNTLILSRRNLVQYYDTNGIQASSILTSPSPSSFFPISIGGTSSAGGAMVLTNGLALHSSLGHDTEPSPGISSPFWIFSRSFSISAASSTMSPVPIFPKCWRYRSRAVRSASHAHLCLF